MAKKTENNGTGWICLHRTFKDWQHYGEPSVMVVFIDLLLSANVKDGWWQGHKCERGATFRSIRSISQDTTLSFHTIIRAMRELESTGEIVRIKIDQKHTKTIICNFAKYQDINYNSVVQSATQSATHSATQSATKQQYNNNNNILEINNNARTHEEIWEEVKDMPITIEQFCKNEGITTDQFDDLGEAVLVDWALTGVKCPDKKYLVNAIRRKAQALKDSGQLVRGTLQERKTKFLAECRELIGKGCDREKVAEFARYYTQLEQGGERMLFETYKGWNTETRYLLNYKK